MKKSGDLHVKRQLFVGNSVIPGPIGFGIGPSKIDGSAYIAGPVIIGDNTAFNKGPNINEATLMVARKPIVNPLTAASGEVDIPTPTPSILKISSFGFTPTPIDVVIGDIVGPVGVNVFCGPMPFNVESSLINLVTLNYDLFSKNRVEVSAASEDVAKKIFSGAKSEIGFDHNLSLAVNSAPISSPKVPFTAVDMFSATGVSLNKTFSIATKALAKNFDVPHPTKDEWRLRHTCLEGPTNDVYIRGKLKGENKIQLPEYWKALIDPETITVSLTSIGTYQELYYEIGPWSSSITVMNSAGGAVNCSYLIHAERIDVEKLIPEYEGTTPQDYPGDNSQYIINGGINNKNN